MEPTAAELLVVIQGSCVALEGNMDSMAIEFYQLCLGLQKMADWTTAFEDDVDALKKEVKFLTLGKLHLAQFAENA
ncbi:hypothetical protein NDU88_004458 [Pleurodeles waltl]|uniref:Uncharacterized protein n=1 Tax=Pleurodeles waltl TaxID=8319 RepID=A0AAV7RL25_PLEWA|nr:hypothetical protein NDU88_004458 [Pleurodeles waltl]